MTEECVMSENKKNTVKIYLVIDEESKKEIREGISEMKRDVKELRKEYLKLEADIKRIAKLAKPLKRRLSVGVGQKITTLKEIKVRGND